MEKQPNRTAAKKIFHVVGLLALALVSVYIIVQCFVIFHRSYKTVQAVFAITVQASSSPNC